MTIPFKVKLLTPTAKAPTQENPGDLWDLYVDSFDDERNPDYLAIQIGDRILVKTGISIELSKQLENCSFWEFDDRFNEIKAYNNQFSLPAVIGSYAVADIRPRSGLALKHGITVLNAPGTIDNSYRKEIGVILYNAGHRPYTINKGDKIAQMLIRPLYPSSMEIVEDFQDTGRGGFGSTGL